jgi:hypothetical protein
MIEFRYPDEDGKENWVRLDRLGSEDYGRLEGITYYEEDGLGGKVSVLNFAIDEGRFWRDWLEVFRQATAGGAAEIHTEVRFAATKWNGFSQETYVLWGVHMPVIPLTIRTGRNTTLSYCEHRYGPPMITTQGDLVLVETLVGKAWGAFTVADQFKADEEEWEQEACGLHYSMQVRDPATYQWVKPADFQRALMQRYLSDVYPAGSPAYDSDMDWIVRHDALIVIGG